MTSQTSTKIMLVEDDVSMQAVLQTLLEIEGYQVIIAPVRKVKQELLTFIIGEKPDVMLLDVHLRELSGIELLEELRQDTHFKNVRVVMTSGLDVQEKSLAAGADSFLLKPYMPEELLNKLKG